MDNRRSNWWKVSKLTMDVAADVLRHLLSTIAQAPFLNDCECLWFQTLQKIENTNCAASLLLRFTKDIRDKDETCRRILRSLIMPWRLTIDQMMPWSKQVESLDQWEKDIEKHQRSSPSNVKEMLSSWCKQIQDTIRTLESMPRYLQSRTKDLLQLFQQYRHDLQEQQKCYFDQFLFSSITKLQSCKSMKKKDQIEVIKVIESDRKEKLETWKMESEKYIKSVGQNIRDCLTSWSQSTIIPEWKKLLDDFETEASEMDDSSLQLSCDTWHKNLHDLFDMCLKGRIEKERLRRKLIHFPSIRSQQVNDFIMAAGQNTLLVTQLSTNQKSTLFPSSDIPNLNECDITLLSILFKNCLVYPPMKGWNDDPPKCDISLGADILRLQSFRRKIIKHLKNSGIDTSAFSKLWRDINDVLCRLACRSGDEYINEVCTKVELIKSFSTKESDVNLSVVYTILDLCMNEAKAELNGILEHRKHKEIKKWIRIAKDVKSRIKKRDETYNSSSDSEGSESSRNSETYNSSSDSGILCIRLRRHSPFEHN